MTTPEEFKRHAQFLENCDRLSDGSWLNDSSRIGAEACRIAAQQDGAWQPIETAPKDGTWFLICRDTDGFDSYEVGSYDPYMTAEYVEVEGGLFRKQMRSSYDWSRFNNFHRATHWRPLPDPPQEHDPEQNRST